MKQTYLFNYKTLLPFFVLMFLLSSNFNASAQCVGPYMSFEGFNSATPAGWLSTAASWNNNVTNANSGRYSATMTTNGQYLTTPVTTKASNMSFNFKTLAGGWSYSVDYSSTQGAAYPGAAWTNVATNSNAAAVSAFTSSGNIAVPTGVYVRITITASVTTYIDDVAFASTAATALVDNYIIVPRVATGATTCTQNLYYNSSTFFYNFYDHGGSNDQLSQNQNSTIKLLPEAGYQIEMEFVSPFAINNAAGFGLTFTDADTALPSTPFRGTTVPAPAPVVYRSTNSTDHSITVKFESVGTTLPQSGYILKVKCAPISATCAIFVSPVTVSNIKYNGAQLNWTPPSSNPTGYDYYVSTSNTAPTNGIAITPTHTTSNQIDYIAGGSLSNTLITGLSSDVLYYAWVRPSCGTVYGNWMQITGNSFRTLCAPVAVPPLYTENFEDIIVQANNLPLCTSATSGSFAINPSPKFYFDNTLNSWFFSKPLLLNPAKIYRLSFDYANSANQSTTVQAYYGSSDYAASAAVTTGLLATETTSSATFATSKSYFQPNSATTPYYIGIKLTGISGGQFKLDNIILEEVPCFPAAVPVISGNVSPCPSTTATYTAIANGTSTSTPYGVTQTTTTTTFNWTFPVGWLITAGQGTNSVTVTTAVSPGNVSAVGTLSGCDSSKATNYALSPIAIPNQPSAITGTGITSVCTTPTTLTYSVTAVGGVSYNWSFPAGFTITSVPINSNSVTVSVAAGASSGTVSVTPVNASLCAGTPRTMTVTVGSVTNGTCATATSMTTPISDYFRCGIDNFWYSYQAPCTGSYKFTTTGPSGDIDLYYYGTCGGLELGFSEGLTANESITANLIAGQIYYIEVFRYSGTNPSFTLSVADTSMGALGVITGPLSVSCSSITTATYSIAAVTGPTSYTWTAPPGWTINSGQGTTSINVTTNGTTAGLMSVYGNGVCGTTSAATLAIAVGQITPGAITGDAGLCTSTVNTVYSIAPVAGATSYTWTYPLGWTPVSGINTTTFTVTPGASGGTIAVTASGPCGTSPAATLAVSTAAAVTSTGVAVCAGNSGTLSATLNSVNTFVMADIPVGAPRYIRSSTLGASNVYVPSTQSVIYGTTTIYPTVTGDYTIAGCASQDTFLQVYQGSFNPASPATNFLMFNDDGNGAVCGLDPKLTITLTAGQAYVLVYSGYDAPINSITGINITVTPDAAIPTGGFQVGTIEWYLASSGGTAVGTGTSFNPVGVDPALPNTNTPAVHTYYATNSLSSFCRTATTFTINPRPTVTITNSPVTVCANTVTPVTVTGTANTYTWTSSVAGTLFSNPAGTIAYIANTNSATVYVRTSATVTVTATGTTLATTCNNTSNLVITVSTKTWNGSSWVPAGAPAITDSVIISGSGTFGNLSGCSCTVNGGAAVAVEVTGVMTLTGDLTVTAPATLTFNDDSSLVQTATPASNTNVGTIIYKRATTARKFDYTYWSSPVGSQYLYQTSSQTGFLDNSNIDLPMQPDKYYWFVNTNSPTYYNWAAPTPGGPLTTMNVGRGYIIRAPLTANELTPSPFAFTFKGKPNNGDYTVNIFKYGANDLNCIGNPYPSAIDAVQFISQNSTAFGTGTSLYFWTHNTLLTGPSFDYNPGDYAIFNYNGSVSTSGATPAPNGKIAAGQAFMALGVNAGATQATFRNGMRLGGATDNTYFYKSNEQNTNIFGTDAVASLERNRIWLDLENENGLFKQILVGYIENATNDYDSAFDAPTLDIGNTVNLYSFTEGKKLTIQGKALPFNDSDLIPLGFKTNINSTFTISLSHFDGIFDSQQVYLEDKQLNVTHHLNTSPYSFVSDVGTFDTRFVLRFTANPLSVVTPAFDENAVIAFKENSDIKIKTLKIAMKSIQIYDTKGSLVAEQEKVNSNSAVFSNLNFANQVLIVNITSVDGVTVSKKIVF